MIRISMSLRYKLGGAFSVFLVFFFGCFSLFHLYSLNEEVQGSLLSDLAVLNFAATGREIFGKIRKTAIAGLQECSRIRIEEVIPEIVRLKNHVQTANTLEIKNIATLSPLLAQINDYVQEVASLAKQAPDIDIQQILQMQDSQEKILEIWRSLELSSMTLFQTTKGRITQITKTLQMRMAILAIVTVAGTIALSFFFSLQIKLPVRRLRVLIDSIRDGNYDFPVRSGTNDELEPAFNALSQMTRHISIRDRLKFDKIGLEKKRFAALANGIGAPLMMLNSEQKIAFANNQCLEFFRLTWDDVYEVDLKLAGVPVELKSRIELSLKTHDWPVCEPMDLIGENYAYEMHLTFIPIPDEKGQIVSLLAILGKLERPQKNGINV